MRVQSQALFVAITTICTIISIVNGAGTITTVQLTLTNSVVGENSNYNIVVQSTIDNWRKIKIIFPVAFYTITSNSYSCNDVSDPTFLVTCTGSSTDNSIVLSSSASKTLIIFSISGIKNPPSTLVTQSLQLYMQDSLSNTIDSKITGIIPTLTPGTLQSPTLSALTQIAGASSILQVKFTPQHAIPTSSSIVVTLPKYNLAEGAQSYQLKSMISSSTPTCTPISGFPAAASLTCAFDSATDQLTVSNGFLNGGNTNLDQVSFTVDSFTNPFSMRPKGTFTVVTKASGGGSIDSVSGLTLTVGQAGTLVPTIFSQDNTTINAQAAYTFSFTYPNLIEPGSTLQILFPTGVTLNTGNYSINPLAGLESGMSLTATSSSITITNGFTSYQEAGGSILFQIRNVINPSSTRQTPGFSIIIKDKDGYLSQQVLSSSLMQVTATPASINNIQLTLSSQVINQKTSYVFSFKPTSSLPSTGTIYIYFPSTIVLDVRSGPCLANSNLQGFSASATCISDSSTLTIQSGFPSGYTGGTLLSIEVDNVKNPPSTQLPSTFAIETWDNLKTSSGAVTDRASSLSLITSLTSGTISGTDVLTVVNPTTGTPSLYTFSFVLTNSILQGGYIQISLPSAVSIASSASISDTSGFVTTPSITVDTTARSIEIKNGFTTAASSSSATLKFSISEITNPRSFAPVTNFVLGTYDSAGYKIDQMSPSPTVSMRIAVALGASTSVSPDILVNSAQTDYTVKISPTVGMLSSDVIAITFPSSVTLSAGIQCTTSDSGIQSISNCQYIAPSTVNISLSFTSSPMSSAFTFKVKNIVNPISTKPSNSIQIFTNDSSGYSSQQMTSGLVVKTTTAMDISSKASVSADSLLMNANAVYTFSITTTINLPQNYYILITFPSDVVAQGTLEINGVSSNLGTPTIQQNGQKVKTSLLPQVNSGQTLSFSISTLKNPSDTTNSRVITVEIYTVDDYVIQSTFSAISLTYSCGSTCLACSGTPTFCTACGGSYPLFYSNACYTTCPDGTTNNGLGVCVSCDASSRCKTCQLAAPEICLTCPDTFNLLSSVDQKCYSSCPQGTYKPATQNICTPCAAGSNCATCNASNPSQCFTCLSSSPLFSEIDNKCYDTTCPDGTALSTALSRCVACTPASNCKTCSVSALAVCGSCLNTYPYLSLIDNTCKAQCPNETAIVNSGGTYVCQQCTLSSHCNTCQASDLSVCLTCLTTYPYFHLDDKTCYATCPLGYSKVGTNCVACSPNCKYCNDGDINYCTACQASTPYLNVVTHTCVSSCDPPYFLDSVASQCKICNTNAHCSTCSVANTDNCLTCDPAFPLYFSGTGWCYSSCPPTSYPSPANSTSCDACSSSCYTCEGAPDNCTSCSGSLPYLYGNTCVTICPTGYKTDAKTGKVCVPEACDPQCQPGCDPPAYDSSISQCICAAGYSTMPGDDTCIESCPTGYYSNSRRVCSKCFDGCLSCVSDTNCTQCSGSKLVLELSCVDSCPTEYYIYGSVCLKVCNHYIYERSCLQTCPEGMTPDSSNVCVYATAKVGPIAPFFLIFGVVALVVLLRLERKYKENLFFSNAIALLSLIEFWAWILLLALYFVEGFGIEGGLVVVALVLILGLNRLFMRLYNRRILMKDDVYTAWRKEFLKKVRIIELISGIISLRFLRIVFGRMTKSRITRARFGHEKEAKKLFNNFALASMLTGNFLVLVSNFLSFSSVIKKSQLFMSIIETSILSAFMIFFTTFSYTIFANDGFEQEPHGGDALPKMDIFGALNHRSANDSVSIDIEKGKDLQQQLVVDQANPKRRKNFVIGEEIDEESESEKDGNASGKKDVKAGTDVEATSSPGKDGTTNGQQLNDSTLVQKIGPDGKLNDSNVNDSRAILLNESFAEGDKKTLEFGAENIQGTQSQSGNGFMMDRGPDKAQGISVYEQNQRKGGRNYQTLNKNEVINVRHKEKQDDEFCVEDSESEQNIQPIATAGEENTDTQNDGDKDSRTLNKNELSQDQFGRKNDATLSRAGDADGLSNRNKPADGDLVNYRGDQALRHSISSYNSAQTGMARPETKGNKQGGPQLESVNSDFMIGSDTNSQAGLESSSRGQRSSKNQRKDERDSPNSRHGTASARNRNNKNQNSSSPSKNKSNSPSRNKSNSPSDTRSKSPPSNGKRNQRSPGRDSKNGAQLQGRKGSAKGGLFEEPTSIDLDSDTSSARQRVDTRRRNNRDTSENDASSYYQKGIMEQDGEEEAGADYSMFPFRRPPARKPNVNDYMKSTSPKRRFEINNDNLGAKKRSKTTAKSSIPKPRPKVDRPPTVTGNFNQEKLKEAFSREDNEITRLLKATMINTNYKRDLNTNQVIQKSTYAYDEMKKNPNSLSEYDKQKTQLISRVKDIKQNKFLQYDHSLYGFVSNNQTGTDFTKTPTKDDKNNRSMEDESNMQQHRTLDHQKSQGEQSLRANTIKQLYLNSDMGNSSFDDGVEKRENRFTTPKNDANKKIIQNLEFSKEFNFLEDL